MSVWIVLSEWSMNRVRVIRDRESAGGRALPVRDIARQADRNDELIGLSAVVAVLVWAACVKLRAVVPLYLFTWSNWREPQVGPWLTTEVSGRPALILSVLGISVLLVLVWLAQRAGRTSLVGLGLFTGGAAANTTERLVFGRVIDYLPVPGAESVIVNLADVIIVAGYLLFAVPLILHYVRRQRAFRS